MFRERTLLKPFSRAPRKRVQAATDESSFRGAGSATFLCNICESECSTPLESLSRETVSCAGCGSTPRFRAVVSVLAQELFGRQLSLPRFPINKQIQGIGLSDWGGYAGPMAEKLSYANSFLDRKPVVDVTLPQPAHAESCDFVIASEVFEHVAPPVEQALRHVHEMLKPGGFMLLTVPFTLGSKTLEHFPNLAEYEVLDFKGERILVNLTKSGKLEVFENLVFHGGTGLTLEMRLFCKDGLLASLAAAGFAGAQIVSGAREFGACWPEPWSLPVVARRASPGSL